VEREGVQKLGAAPILFEKDRTAFAQIQGLSFEQVFSSRRLLSGFAAFDDATARQLKSAHYGSPIGLVLG